MVFEFRPELEAAVATREFPGNSHNERYEKKTAPVNGTEAKATDETEKSTPKLKKPITGKVTRSRPSIGQRFGQVFGGDTLENAINYVVFEVLVPKAKDAVGEAIKQGIDRLIYGESATGRPGPRPGAGHTNYQSRYQSPLSGGRYDDNRDRRARPGYRYDNIVFDRRSDAEDIRNWIYDVYEEYGQVSVAQVLEECGEQSDYTDEKHGWTSLYGTKVRPGRTGGFVVDLPRPQPLT